MALICKSSRIHLCSLGLIAVRPITTSLVLHHNPALKKKSKALVDAKKLQRQKAKQDLKMRKQGLTPPEDPDSKPDISLFALDRQRPQVLLSEEEVERRVTLRKEWCRYQMKKHVDDLKSIRDKYRSRADALKQLRKESTFLYEEAMKVDKNMFPLTIEGPMETPPMENYEPPDFVD